MCENMEPSPLFAEIYIYIYVHLHLQYDKYCISIMMETIFIYLVTSTSIIHGNSNAVILSSSRRPD